MAGLMDRFLDMMHLGDEEDYFYDDYDEEEEVPVVKKQPKPATPKKKPSTNFEDVSEPKQQTRPKQVRSPKVVPMRSNFNPMEVCVIKPTSVEEAREISDTLLTGRAVILNLEGLQVNTAQRIIDFTSGACYSINGNLKMVSNYIFIVTPEAVDISGDFKELFSGSGSSVDVATFNSTF
ncbi:MAG: cell division protein SepF [Lachnospiraceae bacterium]|nr:cell division protein SepF [Lachnospiraceae bacterium]